MVNSMLSGIDQISDIYEQVQKFLNDRLWDLYFFYIQMFNVFKSSF